MFRKLLLLLALALALARPAVAADAPEQHLPCVEAVVLARFVEYRPRELPAHDEDEIVMSWTWDVDIDVRKVYFGPIRPGRLTIGATLHAGFDERLKQPVLFLVRQFDTWYLSSVEFAARDPSGRMVIPVFEAPDEYSVVPTGWMPRDYANWLKPVRYRSTDVAPFADIGSAEDSGSDDEWRRARKGRWVAKRGFRVEDIPAMLAQRRALDCGRERPGGETAARP